MSADTATDTAEIDWRGDAERAKAGNPVPSGFVLKKRGLFRRSTKEGEPDLYVAGLVEVVALTHDGAGNDWGILLQWKDADGRHHEWAMPRELLAGDCVAIRERLLREGLFIHPNRVARDAFATFLMTSNPSRRVRITRQVGWTETPNGSVFVLPTESIGPGGDEVRLQTERPDLIAPIAERGTLESWKREVATPAAHSHRCVFAISMALAPPLLSPLRVESGGVNLFGPSSIGKTTTLKGAGSVWGSGGRHGFIRSWRATDNGLEAVAAAYNDLLLPLDEIAEITPSAAGVAAYPVPPVP